MYFNCYITTPLTFIGFELEFGSNIGNLCTLCKENTKLTVNSIEELLSHLTSTVKTRK